MATYLAKVLELLPMFNTFVMKRSPRKDNKADALAKMASNDKQAYQRIFHCSLYLEAMIGYRKRKKQEEIEEGKGTMKAQIDQLLNVEKQMRLAGEVANMKKAVTNILQLCFEAKD
ncbi:hypothetical protein LWI29_012513 [Acer saccharum]|uniref:Uncharacterized protein n=1 Tax=Acer saccharum TaxID=4024 RepID=A0AA39RV99_ACESA|nr:hypothetical protein LWI29_012513 [Acer saccharum]